MRGRKSVDSRSANTLGEGRSEGKDASEKEEGFPPGVFYKKVSHTSVRKSVRHSVREKEDLNSPKHKMGEGVKKKTHEKRPGGEKERETERRM